MEFPGSLSSPGRIWGSFALVLALVCILFYGRLADHGFDTHDREYLEDSARISAGAGAFFAADKHMPGRPLFEALFWGGYALWGKEARSFHLLGATLHALAAFALARLARRLGMGWGASLASGLLFVACTAPFQAVHWISAHCYPLALLCALGGVGGYLRWCEEGRQSGLIACYAGLVGGVLAHAAAMSFWPVCLLFSWLRGHARARVLRVLPLGPVLLLLLLVLRRVFAQAPQVTILAGQVDGAGIGETFLFFWGRLLSTAFWLPFAPHELHAWELGLGAGALAATLLFLWKRSWPLAGVGGWIFLTLLPPLALAPEYVQSLAAGPSRYLYLPAAGLCLGLGWGVGRLGRWGWIGVGMLLLSGWAAQARAGAISYYTEGRNYLAEGDIEAGVAQLEKALERDGAGIDREDAYLRLVPMLMNRGADPGPRLEEARHLFPRNPTLHLYEQVLRAEAGDGEADAHLRGFAGHAQIAPIIAEVYYHLGKGLYRRGERERAAAAWRAALAFNPELRHRSPESP